MTTQNRPAKAPRRPANAPAPAQAATTTGDRQSGAQRVTVTIPRLPPSVNHQYRPNGRGGRLLTADVTDWRREVWAELRAAGHQAAPAGPLKLTLRLCFGSKRRQDLDNRLKSLIDALALALDFDDCRIVAIDAAVEPGPAPRCTLTLEAV